MAEFRVLEKLTVSVQELIQQGGSNDIKLAMESLKEVTEEVDAAVAAQELQDAQEAILEGLSEAGKLVIKSLGSMLLFDDADVIGPHGDQIMKVLSLLHIHKAYNKLMVQWYI